MSRIFILSPLICILFCIPSRSESMVHGLERSEAARRRPLQTNKQAAIYEELRDPDVVKTVLKSVQAEAAWAGIRVLFGGSESRFSVFIQFFESPSEAEHIADAITNYARLRWLGLSQHTALNLIATPNPLAEAESERTNALKRAAPWLPFSKLRPVRSTELAAIFWAEEGTCFIFEDVDVSFVVLFGQYGKRLEALIYAIDSRETLPRTRAAVLDAAKTARLKLGGGSGEMLPASALLFWRELRDLLKKRGIDWLSPEELNPETDWH